MFRIIDRYIVRQVFGPFLFGLGLLTFALVAGRLLKLSDLVINHGVTLSEVGVLIGLIMPGFLEMTFPMALFLGVLLGFGRMSGDQELTAARACGISLYRLAAPVMALAMVIYACSSWFAFSLKPWANTQLRDCIFQLTQTRTTAALKEKIFNSSFPGLVLYADHVGPDSNLRDVLISDERKPAQQYTIIARSGTVIADKRDRTTTLRLLHGSIFGADPHSGTSHVTSFKTYDLTIKPDATSYDSGNRDPEEMSYSRLRKTIAAGRAAGKPDFDAETELASRFTVPLATLLFALAGVPLGLKPARGGQSERFGVSVAMFFFYYALMRVGEAAAQRGTLNAMVAMSIPNAAFAVLAVWLFLRSARDHGDQTRGPGDFVWDLIERYERRREAA